MAKTTKSHNESHMIKGDWRRQMLSDIISEVDYDIWKAMFYYGGTDDSENRPEDDEKIVQKLVDIVQRALEARLKKGPL